MPVIKFDLKKKKKTPGKALIKSHFLQPAIGSDSTVTCEKTSFKGAESKRTMELFF